MNSIITNISHPKTRHFLHLAKKHREAAEEYYALGQEKMAERQLMLARVADQRAAVYSAPPAPQPSKPYRRINPRISIHIVR